MKEEEKLIRKIGLFGGSFNPIHRGHVALAKQILDKVGLDEVWFVVSPLNPLKAGASDLLADEQRLELVQLALCDEPHLVACDYEFDLPKPSYTWHTLQSLQHDYPDCQFTLIIGGDNWVNFRKWYRADDIIRNYSIVVYPREGSEIKSKDLPPNVRVVRTELYKMSSTEVRKRIREGLPVADLLPSSSYQKTMDYYSLPNQGK